VTFLIGVDDRCTGCGLCIATCPEGAVRAGVKRPVPEAGRCTACLACIEVCPVDAITVETGP
jgi:ferredoxin